MEGLKRKGFIYLVLLSLCSVCVNICGSQQWTWSYKKIFDEKEFVGHGSCKEVIFSKKNIKNFSQLIFSWNSVRPSDGHFSFYVKTRNSVSKKWSRWHKMIDWGSGMQKSYFSKDDETKYVYVRLETGSVNLADAFTIKIESCNDVHLELLKSVCVCTSDFNKFKPEKIDARVLHLKSIHIRQVPKISQRTLNHPHTSRICSPTSCSMLVGYFSKEKIDAAMFADTVFDHGLRAYGSWPFNVAELYGRCNTCCNTCCNKCCDVSCDVSCACTLFFYIQRMNSFVDLHKKLLKKIPVVVSVRGKLTGAPKAYNGGHLMVVVGWDAKRGTVICHDPAFYSDKSTRVAYPLDTFLKGWERSHRLAYVADVIDENYIK
ncbi:C39 family peptidase [Candidatus Dependentiae bacterium]